MDLHSYWYGKLVFFFLMASMFLGSIPNFLCGVCSPCVCVGFLRVILLPPTVQIYAC